MSYKAILRTVPVIQASALLGDNLKHAKKKKLKVKDMVGQGVKNIIGIELMSETANIIES